MISAFILGPVGRWRAMEGKERVVYHGWLATVHTHTQNSFLPSWKMTFLAESDEMVWLPFPPDVR